MDKNKIIDDILNEWAMRSHDGLVSGHDTPENMEVLQEILAEKRLSISPEERAVEKEKAKRERIVARAKAKQEREAAKKKAKEEEETKKALPVGVPEEALQDKYFITKRNGKKISNNNPYYKDGTPFEFILSGEADMTLAGIEKNLGDKIEGKNISETYVRLILKAVKQHSIPGEVSFLSFYNKCDINLAIKVIRDYPEIVKAIEKDKKTLLGRGELTFVFLLKGAKTGGKGVDILLVEGLGDIEVKEVKGKELKIQISAATFNGWDRSETKTAIDELATELRHDKNFGLYLKNEVLEGKNPDNTPKYPARERGSRKKAEVTEIQKEYFEDFITRTRTSEMHSSLFYAFEWIWQKLLSPFPKKTSGKSDNAADVGRAKLSISVGNDTKEFSLVDPQKAAITVKDVSNTLKQKNSPSNIPVSLDVSKEINSTGEEKDAEEYYYLAKSLDYFKNKITKETITAEINEIAKTKYSGYLVIYEKNGYYDAVFARTKNSILEFSSLGLAKINAFLKANVPGLKPMPDEEK
jgi:hypothetical protein